MLHRLCFNQDSTGKPLRSNQPDLKEPSEGPAPPKSKPKKKKGKGAKEESPSICAAGGNSLAKDKQVSAWSYEMFGHVSQTVDRYLELSGKDRSSLKTKVATPCIDDHLIPPEEFEVKGTLSPIAARVVLKALYVARIAR
jgi:hypothetical protein